MSRHLVVALLVLSVGAAAVSFGALRPQHNDRLPYSSVVYGVRDAKAAFAAEGIRLTFRSRTPAGADLSNARNVIIVDVFGAPDVVRRTGFRDLEHGADCSVEGHLALHWRGNVRAILDCGLVTDDAAWIGRMDRALASLR